MISESIYTQRTLEKDQNQKQKSAESDQDLHYLLKILEKMGMILLMINYQKKPIETGSEIKCCNFLMKLDKTFKDSCIHKTWATVGQADRDTDKAESKAFFFFFFFFDCIEEM